MTLRARLNAKSRLRESFLSRVEELEGEDFKVEAILSGGDFIESDWV